MPAADRWDRNDVRRDEGKSGNHLPVAGAHVEAVTGDE